MDEAIEWLREQIEDDRRRAEAMGHFTVHEQPYYSCAGSRTEPYGDLPWGEDACDCFLAQRKGDALAKCEAELAILDEHGPSRRDATRCRVCTAIADGHAARFRAPCPTVRAVASGYRRRPGYAEHWDEALITS